MADYLILVYRILIIINIIKVLFRIYYKNYKILIIIYNKVTNKNRFCKKDRAFIILK